MEINEEVLEILKEFKVFPADGICYLISLFHGYNPTYIPEEIRKKVNMSGIVVNNNGNLHWNVPLYNNQMTGFDWVTKEYIPLFEDANSDKRGSKASAISRMKKLFAKYPDIRKDEVLGATNMYILNTDSKYIRMSHYFIEKGAGAAKTMDILDWIEKYRLSKQNDTGRISITRRLQ